MAIVEQRFSWASYIIGVFRRKRSNTETASTETPAWSNAPETRSASGSASRPIKERRTRSDSGSSRFRFLKLASMRSITKDDKEAMADFEPTRYDPPSFYCREISVSISASSSDGERKRGGRKGRSKQGKAIVPFRYLFKAKKTRRRSSDGKK